MQFYIHATWRNRTKEFVTYSPTRVSFLTREAYTIAERELAKAFPHTWDDFRLFSLEHKTSRP